MNFINSFNVQGDPCVMGYNKLVVPFTDTDGLKAPTILTVLLGVVGSSNNTITYTKEEFLQFFGGAFPETSGSYLLVENIEDSSGFTLKWNECTLSEKYLESEDEYESGKVYTILYEDILLPTLYGLFAAGDDIYKILILLTSGLTIIDIGEQVLLTIGLPIF